MKLAIVILNWNGKKLLEQFLPSVVAYSEEADLYVADNASTDDSIAFIEKTYPQITIIKNKTNGGYAKGYNDALQHVNADVFCLLNSDVEVTKNWLKPIITLFSENQNASIAQPKICSYKQKDTFEYAGAGGGFIDKYGFPFCRGRIFDTLEKDTGQYNNTCRIFWASGACLFVRKDVFTALRGFDEDFFAHFEEIDLCWRAQQEGFEVWYVGNSTVYHLGGGTLNNTSPQKTYLNFRNSLYCLTKNLPKNKLFTVLFTRLVLDGVAALRFVIQLKFAHMWAILKSHVLFYKNLKNNLKKRKKPITFKKYYFIKSIVYEYFVSNKKSFMHLIKH